MVSDTPSSKDENRKRETTEDAAPATLATEENASLSPKADDAAVESAMADVAAAMKRHEDHRDGDESETPTEKDKTVSDAANPAADVPPVPPLGNPAEPEQPARGPGFGSLLAAGIAGAVIALAGVYALSEAGVLGKAEDTRIDGEIAALRQEVETLKTNDGSADLESQFEALKKQVDSATGSNADIAAIKQQLSALQSTQQSDDGALKSLQSGFDQLKSSLSSGQQAVEQKLSALEAKVNTPGKDLAVARAIAAAALKSAIDRGDSFITELSTYAEVAPESANIERLKSLAGKGIPTREALSAEFSANAEAIIEATAPPLPEGNIFNRLVDSAKGLVSVRPVGDVEGDSVPAIVARIENALAKGDLKTAEAEWETLPEAGKQASSKFADGLKARIEADNLVSGALATALSATAGGPVAPATSPAN